MAREESAVRRGAAKRKGERNLCRRKSSSQDVVLFRCEILLVDHLPFSITFLGESGTDVYLHLNPEGKVEPDNRVRAAIISLPSAERASGGDNVTGSFTA